jgi:hypothetical protein
MTVTAPSNKFIVGIYNDDEQVLNAVGLVRGAGIKIHEVYSPYPVHGIDPALGYKRSRLDIAAFMFGTLGCITAFTMINMMNRVDWPMNVGGKPYTSVTLVPITFELTVLFAALGMVTTFFLASGLGPGSNKTVFDPRASDDKFVMAISLDANASQEPDKIMNTLRESGAAEVLEKEVVN